MEERNQYDDNYQSIDKLPNDLEKNIQQPADDNLQPPLQVNSPVEP